MRTTETVERGFFDIFPIRRHLLVRQSLINAGNMWYEAELNEDGSANHLKRFA